MANINLERFGEPTWTGEWLAPDGRRAVQWAYSRRGAFPVAFIHFDPEGNFQHYIYDR